MYLVIMDWKKGHLPDSELRSNDSQSEIPNQSLDQPPRNLLKLLRKADRELLSSDSSLFSVFWCWLGVEGLASVGLTVLSTKTQNRNEEMKLTKSAVENNECFHFPDGGCYGFTSPVCCWLIKKWMLLNQPVTNSHSVKRMQKHRNVFYKLTSKTRTKLKDFFRSNSPISPIP